jgi:hypothetical protein
VNGAGSSGGVLSTVIYQITSATVAQVQSVASDLALFV